MIKIQVQVKPNSKTDSAFMENGILKVKIKAPPVDGKANEYLIKYLSEVFDVPRSAISLLRGSTSKLKTLQINLREETFQSILTKL